VYGEWRTTFSIARRNFSLAPVSLPTWFDRLLSGKSVPACKFVDERQIHSRGLSKLDGVGISNFGQRVELGGASELLSRFVENGKINTASTY
jgi:hypothetical protein